ncbi:Calx-beta domain-containing protein [Synechocystis sp. LKSZ1]|uniref:Calx-beta domain-containing protein n=1 Tax=Synechocystis sp. LKSZ1 TaxID=3144951 RepID=UPI00336C02C6
MNIQQFDLFGVYSYLTHFATLESFWGQFEAIYGTGYDFAAAEALRLQWANGDFSQLPAIQVVETESLGTASGAYAQANNTIYLSERFLATAPASVITAVVLEEVGHFVDVLVNESDSPGDEGEYFANVALNQDLSELNLRRLQAENDLIFMVIEGQNLLVEQANFTGTNGNNTILGTAEDDTINPGLGNDKVDGGAGNDLLIVDYSSNAYNGTSPNAGIRSYIYNNSTSGFNGSYSAYYNSGYDDDYISFSGIERFHITGTIANDDIETGDGDDVINSGDGNDTINANDGNDVINAGDGDDVIDNNNGIDTIDAGQGIDRLINGNFGTITTGLSFDETGTTHSAISLPNGSIAKNIEYFTNLITGNGNDVINYSQRTDNDLKTGGGDDTINPGLGYDKVDGGLGNDLLIVNYSSNTYNGTSPNAGIRSSIYNNSTSGFNGSYSADYNSGYDNDYISFSGIERFHITGTVANDDIETGDGDDVINSGGGNDTINVNDGNDIVNAGDGDDVIDNNNGIDTIDAGQGIDRLINGNFGTITTGLSFDETGTTHSAISLPNGSIAKNIEYFTNLITGNSDDVINYSQRTDNDLKTGGGDDTINPGLGYDKVDGGLGNDLLIVDYSSNTYNGTSPKAGIRSSIYNNSTSGFNGSYSADYNSGYDNDYISFSGIERFHITGTVANDDIETGDGDDVINSGGGNDTINANDGNDIVNAGDGDDVIDNNNGIDTIDAGQGIDRLINGNFGTITTGLSFDEAGTTHSAISLPNGSIAKNIEYFTNLITGNGNDVITYSQRTDNDLKTGGGDDTINPGLGYDKVDGGLGNDLLIVDYSSNTYNGTSPKAGIRSSIYNNSTSGFNGSYSADYNSGYDNDYISFSGIERFHITGTVANDDIETGDGDDVINGGGGKDSLYGNNGNDSYILNVNNAAGSVIYDSIGNDRLTLNGTQISLVKAEVGKVGLGRLNQTLIIDLNQDGILDANTDLSIEKFYNDPFSSTPGSGFLETVDNLSGLDIIQTIVQNNFPSLSIQDSAIWEGNSGTKNLTFTVTLSPASLQPVTVKFATSTPSGHTATSNVDFTATNGTLTIPAGQLTGQINVPIIGDTTNENSETFVVNLSNASNAVIQKSQAIGTIEQDDTPTSPLVLTGGTVQIAYVAYYGRPGDPGGLAFWNQVFGSQPVVFGSPEFETLANNFGTGSEANRLYGALSNRDKVKKVYNLAFNRDPEQGGWDFWTGLLDQNKVTPVNFALAVALGASNGEEPDLTILRNKVASADLISKAIDTPLERQATSGPSNEVFGRNWLAPFGDTSASLYAAETALAQFVASAGF